MNNLKKAKMYILLFLCVTGWIITFKEELQLLFTSDPPKEYIYTYSFHDESRGHYPHITRCEGFIWGSQGLQLPPGVTGEIVFAFDKEKQQGSLLRLWFYGDGGKLHPNAIHLSADGGKTFMLLSSDGNYVGEVFDLSPYVRDSRHFQLRLTSKNNAYYSTVVLDKIDLVVARGSEVRPALPPFPSLVGILFLLMVVVIFLAKGGQDVRGSMVAFFVMLILLLALWLRWNTLLNVAGTSLDEDAQGYFKYARKMEVLGENSFYSGQFEKREPLYILLVKLCFLLFGASETHLRLVSLTCSLFIIYFTYKVGRMWFNETVGLIAAFILSVHPYLIELSVRGLRDEWFTVLLLLFVYYGYVKPTMRMCSRVMATGVLMGAVLLTRSESLPMLVVTLCFYPLVARSRWNLRMVLVTCAVGITLLLPHLFAHYLKYGDPFYTVNQYTRFYANREFVNTPGFPTREEIMEQGMYTGKKITPFEYIFRLHTPWQWVKYSLLGMAKIYFSMPSAFASGKGNLRKITYAIGWETDTLSITRLGRVLSLVVSILKENFWEYLMAVFVLCTFMAGLLYMVIAQQWLFLIYLLVFQLQTSFIAYMGIDERLCIHSYPFIAMCCGSILRAVYYWGRKRYSSIRVTVGGRQ